MATSKQINFTLYYEYLDSEPKRKRLRERNRRSNPGRIGKQIQQQEISEQRWTTNVHQIAKGVRF